MTYLKKLGVVSGGSLPALDELLKQLEEFPSANITFVDLLLSFNPLGTPICAEITSWDNGSVVVPHLGFSGRERPQYLLEVLSEEPPKTPRQVSLRRTLRGINQTFDYTKELLLTARVFCTKGYELGSNMKVYVEGQSLDINQTLCFVKLCVKDGEYELTGIPPAPQKPKVPERQHRMGW